MASTTVSLAPSGALTRPRLSRRALVSSLVSLTLVGGGIFTGVQVHAHQAQVARDYAAMVARVQAAQAAYEVEQDFIRDAQRKAAVAQAAAFRAEHAKILADRDALLAADQAVLDGSAGKVDEALRAQLAGALDGLRSSGEVHTSIARASEQVTALTGQVTVAQQAWEAEQARIAAEAAAAAKAAEAARAAKAAQASKAPTRAKSSAAVPAAAAAAGGSLAWSAGIVNSGGQDALDACAGGVTRWFENVDGKPYYPIHVHCGGSPILGLHMGDLVRIGGTTYTVTDARDVSKGASYSAAAGLNGSILIQTCYRNSSKMRIVALT